MGVYRSSDGPLIGRSFFERDPLTCARELIGCHLVWQGCVGRIVETEAYSVTDDEACHAFSRPSTRLFIARHEPGTAYVYLNYGIHWLLNVLVKGGREDGFVLFRALEPVHGIERMAARRGTDRLTALCSGPGKLSQALGVTGADHARDLTGDEGAERRPPKARQVGFQRGDEPVSITVDVRIGISKSPHLPWRFLLTHSPFVSMPPTAKASPPSGVLPSPTKAKQPLPKKQTRTSR